MSFSPDDEKMAGVDQLPAVIGSSSIEMLADMIQRGEKGIASIEKVMMIGGRWKDGWSA